MNPTLLKLVHNIGIERTGRDVVRETTHNLNLPRQSEFQDTTDPYREGANPAMLRSAR